MGLALTPLALRPSPGTVTPGMVTWEFPLLVSVTGNPRLPPTFTVPKLPPVGLAPSKNVAGPGPGQGDGRWGVGGIAGHTHAARHTACNCWGKRDIQGHRLIGR